METCGDKEHVVKPFYLIKLAYSWIFILAIERMTKFIDYKRIWRILQFRNIALYISYIPYTIPNETAVYKT